MRRYYHALPPKVGLYRAAAKRGPKEAVPLAKSECARRFWRCSLTRLAAISLAYRGHYSDAATYSSVRPSVHLSVCPILL